MEPMDRPTPTPPIADGAPVFVHQAFTCCPYAAVITSKIHDYLEANGHPVCDEPEQAAALVVNTCGFNASRSEQALRVIGLLRGRAPDRPLVVAGCLTRIERERVLEAVGDTPAALIGPREHAEFDRVFAPRSVPFEAVRANEYKDRYCRRDPRLGLYQVLVATGCLNQCRYCVIRRAKGDVASRPLATILDEVHRGIAAGHRDVFLVGDDVSCWGADLGTDVRALLTALVEIEPACRFSVEAFEPSRLLPWADDLAALVGSGRFSWIVLPVQSGSDAVLEAMGRQYTAAEAEALRATLKAAAPSMIVSTDFIYGFPGETADDFGASLALARRFDYANFNEYEPRPGTPPVELAADELRRRTEAVTAFLREQGSQVEVLTRNRVLPYDSWSGRDPSVGGPQPPSAWAEDTAAALAALAGVPLAAGWIVEALAPQRQGVVLTAAHDGGEAPMQVMIAPRDEDTPCMARTAAFNLMLLADEAVATLDEGRMEALAALGRRLGGDGG